MVTTPSAKIILDSISPSGDRLTTVECTMHRFVLAEINTHRVFSRNSASSRAIPINKQIDRVLNDLAYPVEWGLNQAGMQANELASNTDSILAREIWRLASEDAVKHVRSLQKIGTDKEGIVRGIHKQVANRLLEPFMWHQVIISSTEFNNFYLQRVTEFSPLAQPEMRAVADAMYEAINASQPTLVPYGEYHTPYAPASEIVQQSKRICVSGARCARVSYNSHSGIRDISEDLAMYGRLTSAKPMHKSPLEHPARPAESGEVVRGNFEGWVQVRQEVEDGLR